MRLRSCGVDHLVFSSKTVFKYDDTELIENSIAEMLCQCCHICRPEFMENATVLWMLIYATLILLEIDVCSVRLMCCINAVCCNVNTCGIQFDQ